MTKQKKTHIRTAIRCIETGAIYKNALAAANAHHATRGAMSNHLAGRAPTLAGFKFERVQP